MEKIKRLNRYQKCMLIVMIAMTLVFAVLYSITTSRVGYEYRDTIFVPSHEGGSTVYSGRIQGQQAHFTVSEDKTVVLQYGDKMYGPYTAKEDPTAIPESEELAEYMTGVELRCEEDILFRGGVLETGDFRLLYNKDGSFDDVALSFRDDNGVWMDENGNVINPVEPTASTILELIDNPEMTHKGAWAAWFCAVFVCALNALSILFADELFRWNLALRVRNADHAEPSDLEIAERYFSWIFLMIIALIFFIRGLQ